MPVKSEIAVEAKPMTIEVLTFPDFPGLRSKLRLDVSLEPASNGVGKVLQHEYHLDVRHGADGRWLVPVAQSMESVIESALESGASPTLSIFESDAAMLNRLSSDAPPLHSAIVQHQINQTVPPQPLPPPARSSTL